MTKLISYDINTGSQCIIDPIKTGPVDSSLAGLPVCLNDQGKLDKELLDLSSAVTATTISDYTLTKTNTSPYSPTQPTHPATKGYVDTLLQSSMINQTFITSESVTIGDVLVWDGSDVSKADITNPAHKNRLIGIALTNANILTSVRVGLMGVYSDPTASYMPMAKLYVGHDSRLTSILPTNAAFIHVAGIVISINTMAFNFIDHYIENNI